ncbi:J domain-containing protein [Hippea sp. KM1]|uniref:J domain-containing protein n=1 Tax=Hippea sp. KM1 TaxID=944481 RepID=UPI00046D14BC|nr:DnaJ domain-containing protein [Hippea sp. KM1]
MSLLIFLIVAIAFLGVSLFILSAILGIGVYLIYLALFLLEILVYAAPSVFIAIIVNSAIMKLIPVSKIHNQVNLCDVVDLRCSLSSIGLDDEPKIEAYVLYDKLNSIIKEKIPLFFRAFPVLSFLLGSLAGAFVSVYMLKNGYMSDVVVHAPQKVTLHAGTKAVFVTALITTVVVSFLSTLILSPSSRVEAGMVYKFNMEVNRMQSEIASLVRKTRDLSDDILEAKEFLGSYPTFIDYIFQAEDEIVKSKCTVLNSPSFILNILHEAYTGAKQEHDRIKIALELYTEAKELINEAENRRFFILNLLFPDKRVKKLKEALFSGNIGYLISQNRWSECFEYLKSIIKEANVILGYEEEDEENKYYYERFDNEFDYENDNYQHSYKEEYQSQEESYSYSSASESDVERACRILGVSIDATPEEIKKAYRKLAAYWHPDAGNTDSDEMIKEINSAYEILKRYKNFS